MRLEAGTVAISGWEVLSAHCGIVAEDMREMAVKARARRRDFVILTKADAVAAKGGRPERQVHRPGRPCRLHRGPQPDAQVDRPRGQGEGRCVPRRAHDPWAALLAPARAACTAAIAAAAAAVAAAEAAAIVVVADHQPPAAPSVAATGAAVAENVDAESKADQRALLAKPTLAMND